MKWITTDKQANTIPLELVRTTDLENWCKTQPSFVKQWVKANEFEAQPHTHCVIPDEQGRIAKVIIGLKSFEQVWALGHCANNLPPAQYQITTSLAPERLNYLAITWGLGAYRFERYKKKEKASPQLYIDTPMDYSYIQHVIQSHCLVRDLINTPANDMHPAALAQITKNLAEEHGASYQEIVGDDLLKEGFMATHTVGRAGSVAPRLVQFTWGNASHPTVALVGKGVCFDSGGLDIKTSRGMLLMKKDMGGAAHVLGLANLIMKQQLPIHLHVCIPMVENVISANAFKPGDIITLRNGHTIEIGNTDAEGRLILADALLAVSDHAPQMILDIATLTGAARVALGTDIAAYFSNDESLAEELQQASQRSQEPIWRLPLYDGYEQYVNSSIADTNNAGNYPYAGAILAALLLQRFIPPSIPWLHFDIMAWNISHKPGRPEGGEAMILRSLYELLAHKFQGSA